MRNFSLTGFELDRRRLVNQHLDVIAEKHFDLIGKNNLADDAISKIGMIDLVADHKLRADAIGLRRGACFGLHQLAPFEFN